MAFKQTVRHPFVSSVFAIVLVALAAALRLRMSHTLEVPRPWLVFYPVVIIAAVIGGFYAGLLATGMACLVVLWPLFGGESLFRTHADWLGMIVFVLTGATMSSVCEATRQTRARADIYHTLVRSLDEGFCVIKMLYDPDGNPVDYRFLECNPAFERHTGLVRAKGKTIRQMVPNHEKHWFEIYGKVARTGEEIRFENAANAMHRYYDVFAFRVGGNRSDRVGILFKDITQQKDAEQALINAALYDKLTGLPNRAMFWTHLAKAIARAERDKHDLALIFLDLDGFKAINDTLGHRAGDAMLCVVAQRLHSNVRAGDLVSRFGGDEFTIVLENCQPDYLSLLAEKFIRALELPVDLEGHASRISASIGIVTYPKSGLDAETLIRRADEAMYSAKKQGTKGYEIWRS